MDQFIGALATTRSQFYPQIGYGFDASRNRTTQEGYPPLGPGSDPYYTLYQGSLGAQWQADRYLQVINVYKAVGGGRVDEAGKLAPQPLLGKK